MRKTLCKTGNSYAIVLDRDLLDATHITPDTPLEVSSNGDIIVISPVRDDKREKKIEEIKKEMYERFSGLFKALAK